MAASAVLVMANEPREAEVCSRKRERPGEPRPVRLFEPDSLRGGVQALGVPEQVIVDERGDEEVAVVVLLLTAQGQLLARFLARGLQQVRLELLFKERIIQALIDQNLGRQAVAVLKQGRRVLSAPCGLIVAQIA